MKEKMTRKLLILAMVLSAFVSANAQSVNVKTYTYTHRGEQPLCLDVYSVNEEVEPCLLYVFGGAFLTGSRAEKEVVETVEDSVTQISLADAKMKGAKFEIGDVVQIPINSREFGRIATQKFFVGQTREVVT